MQRQSSEVDHWVGQALSRIRKQRGLSQAELASALGISFQQIQKYEAGQNRLSASRLFAAADILQCAVGDFFPAPQCAPQSQSDLAASAVYATPEGRRMIENFPRIADSGTRRSLVRIVEALALR